MSYKYHSVGAHMSQNKKAIFNAGEMIYCRRQKPQLFHRIALHRGLKSGQNLFKRNLMGNTVEDNSPLLAVNIVSFKYEWDLQLLVTQDEALVVLEMEYVKDQAVVGAATTRPVQQ